MKKQVLPFRVSVLVQESTSMTCGAKFEKKIERAQAQSSVGC